MFVIVLYIDLFYYYDLMCVDIDYQVQSYCVCCLYQLFGNQGWWYLDLVCGIGFYVWYFFDFGYCSVGLDINQLMFDFV